MKSHILYLSLLILATILSCNEKSSEEKSVDESLVSIEKSFLGITMEGDTVDQYTLSNARGMSLKIMTYGGIINYWTAPNREGKYENIVLGFDSLSQYQKSSPYFGAIVGRYGNRIAKGTFSIDGEDYKLAINNAPNHLHGGIKGFDKVVWEATTNEDAETASLVLSYTSPDGEEVYPGELKTIVSYTLDNMDRLKVEYEASSSKKTVVNLTQHSYFNLSADFTQDVLDHEIMIAADHFLPVDEGLIPTGELRPVKGSPFDFTKPKKIGLEINAENKQIEIGKGYDHCWVFSDKEGDLKSVASAYHSGSGRLLEVTTNEPALQFYTGNFLDGTLPMRNGGMYKLRSGFCLETQHYPDSPNQKDFPSTLLKPGEVYKSETHFKFSIK